MTEQIEELELMKGHEYPSALAARLRHWRRRWLCRLPVLRCERKASCVADSYDGLRDTLVTETLRRRFPGQTYPEGQN